MDDDVESDLSLFLVDLQSTGSNLSRGDLDGLSEETFSIFLPPRLELGSL